MPTTWNGSGAGLGSPRRVWGAAPAQTTGETGAGWVPVARVVSSEQDASDPEPVWGEAPAQTTGEAGATPGCPSHGSPHAAAHLSEFERSCWGPEN